MLVDPSLYPQEVNKAVGGAGATSLIGIGVRKFGKAGQAGKGSGGSGTCPPPNNAPSFSGTGKPWTNGATPNSRYTHIGPDGRAVQNAIYDSNGNVIGHVDFKNHGAGAPSGHGHQFPIPGNPASGHGPGKPHIPHNQLPPGWSNLPPGVLPRTPIGQ